jgi:integrase/recombinase XerD
MANAQNFTVSFIIRTGRMTGEEAPIFAPISVDSKRTEFSIKRKVAPNLWNKEAGKVKPKSKEAARINMLNLRNKLSNNKNKQERMAR